MDNRHILRWSALLLLTASLLTLTACGGNSTEVAPTSEAPVAASESAEVEDTDNDIAEDSEQEAEPVQATLTPAAQIPESLAVHPDAFDFEVSPASNTYIYYVPMMVAETTEYMLEALTTLGWEELGKPTVMGHLATMNMQMDSSRLTISMQDNELSETTRIQMVFIK